MPHHGHFRELTDEDIKQMAREAEAENLQFHPPFRKPRGWHFRRVSILLGLLPLADMTLDEVVWHLSERMTLAAER